MSKAGKAGDAASTWDDPAEGVGWDGGKEDKPSATGKDISSRALCGLQHGKGADSPLNYAHLCMSSLSTAHKGIAWKLETPRGKMI